MPSTAEMMPTHALTSSKILVASFFLAVAVEVPVVLSAAVSSEEEEEESKSLRLAREEAVGVCSLFSAIAGAERNLLQRR